MVWKVILGIILLAIVITAIKAYFFKPKKSELERPPLEPEKADAKRAAEHLSKALTFQTIARTNPAEIKANLVAQLTAPVRWTQSVQNMIADGATEFVELGPGKVLQGLVAKISREVAVSGKQ